MEEQQIPKRNMLPKIDIQVACSFLTVTWDL